MGRRLATAVAMCVCWAIGFGISHADAALDGTRQPGIPLLAEADRSGDANAADSTSGDIGDYELARFGFSIQPLGMLQFGPIIGADIRLGANVLLGAHLRYAALGLWHGLTQRPKEGADYELHANSMAVGVGGRYLLPLGYSRHRPYAGGIVEVAWSGMSGDPNAYWEWVKRTVTVVTAASGGYRLRFGSGFFLELGGITGLELKVYEKQQYTNQTLGERPETQRSVRYVGQIVLALGWELRAPGSSLRRLPGPSVGRDR